MTTDILCTCSYCLQCSVACGEGIQTRAVACYSVADNVLVNESFCLQNASMSKPRTQNSCRGTSCVGKWGYDDWGKVC